MPAGGVWDPVGCHGASQRVLEPSQSGLRASQRGKRGLPLSKRSWRAILIGLRISLGHLKGL